MELIEDFFNPAEKKLSILYVEDSPLNREHTLSILKNSFADTIAAEDGHQGIELFKKHRPDIVITDVRMPGMDGITMARNIKEIQEDIPIVITSAYDDREILLQSIHTGVTRFILKPVNRKELLSVLDELRTVILLRRRIALQQSFIRTALDSTDVLTIITDGRSMVGANRAALSFTGFTSLSEFLENHQCLSEFFLAIEDSLSGKDNWLEIALNSALPPRIKMQSYIDGSVRIFSARVSPIPEFHQHYIVSLFDITELELQRQELEKLATIDPLTGAYNRHHFNTILAFNIRRNQRYHHQRPFSILILDIDYFKSINDTLGHLVGDDLLKQFTERLQMHIRKSDFLARWGGEEFVILAPETDLEQAIQLGEKVRRIIAEHSFRGIDRPITISAGVTQFQMNDTINSIIHRADQALYKAKKAGRNCVRSQFP